MEIIRLSMKEYKVIRIGGHNSSDLLTKAMNAMAARGCEVTTVTAASRGKAEVQHFYITFEREKAQ